MIRTLAISMLMFTAAALNAQNKYLLKEVDVYASCADYEVRDMDNKKVSLPPAVANGLKCPAVLTLTEGHLLTHMQDLWVMQYDLADGVSDTLFLTFAETEGISGPWVSPDGKRFAFVLIDQQKRNGYREWGRIIVVEKNGHRLVSKRKYDRLIHFVCGSTCFVEADNLKFKDNSTILFRRSENIDDRPGKWETIKLNQKENEEK